MNLIGEQGAENRETGSQVKYKKGAGNQNPLLVNLNKLIPLYFSKSYIDMINIQGSYSIAVDI